MSEICPRCCRETEQLIEPACEADPDLMAGPGMIPCPDCGMLLEVGEPHPLLCEDCVRKTR